MKHRFTVSDSQLSGLIKLGEVPFQLPILVTRDGFIIDGYARWELAKRQKREKILCLEYVLSEKEGIRWLIQTHLPSKGLNSYCRAQLALDLEPSLRETACVNQQRGGANQKSLDFDGSSTYRRPFGVGYNCSSLLRAPDKGEAGFGICPPAYQSGPKSW